MHHHSEIAAVGLLSNAKVINQSIIIPLTQTIITTTDV